MSGVKGKSGRKPKLEDYKVEELLCLSHKVLARWLSNPEVPNSKKVPVALELIKRRIPQNIKNEGALVDLKVAVIRPSEDDRTNFKAVAATRRSDFLKGK